MTARKVYQLLQKLKNNDLQKILEMLQSTYFGDHTHLMPLFELILEYAPHYNDKQLASSEIIRKMKLYETTFNEAKLNKYFFQLTNLVEEHILISQNKENKKRRYLKLLDFCIEQNVEGQYQVYAKKLQGMLSKEKIRFSNYWKYQMQLERKHLLHESLNDRRTGETNIQKASDALDLFFAVEKLTLMMAAHTREHAVNIKYELGFRQELLEKIQKEPLKDFFSINILQNNLMLLSEENKLPYYQFLKQRVVDSSDKISPQILEGILAVFNNTMGSIFRGNQYYKELLELYLLQIEKKLIPLKTASFAFLYQNVVTACLNLNNMEEALLFVNKHKTNLPSELKVNYYNFNLARIEFEKQDFDKVLDHLNECFPKDMMLTLGTKRLYLKCFYELNQYSLFDSNQHALNMYLRRLKAAAGRHVKAHKNFLHFTGLLFKQRINPNLKPAKILAIEQEILETAILPEKKWLLEKIKLFNIKE